jgi:hypothetical protein
LLLRASYGRQRSRDGRGGDGQASRRSWPRYGCRLTRPRRCGRGVVADLSGAEPPPSPWSEATATPWNGAATVRAQRSRGDPPSSAAPPPSELSAAAVEERLCRAQLLDAQKGKTWHHWRIRAVGFKFKCGCVGGGEDEGDEEIFEEGDDR